MSDELTKQVASLRALARKMKRYSVDMVDLTYVENVEWCADALAAAEQRAERVQAERDEAVADNAAMVAMCRRVLGSLQENYELDTLDMPTQALEDATACLSEACTAVHPGSDMLAELKRLAAMREALVAVRNHGLALSSNPYSREYDDEAAAIEWQIDAALEGATDER